MFLERPFDVEMSSSQVLIPSSRGHYRCEVRGRSQWLQSPSNHKEGVCRGDAGGQPAKNNFCFKTSSATTNFPQKQRGKQIFKTQNRRESASQKRDSSAKSKNHLQQEIRETTKKLRPGGKSFSNHSCLSSS